MNKKNNQFNLVNYMLLNEALTSNILQNEILNEPSGFFRYVKNVHPRKLHDVGPKKMQYKRTIMQDVENLFATLKKTFVTIFNSSYNYCTHDYMQDNKVLDPAKHSGEQLTFKYASIPDDVLIKANKKYNQDVLKLQKKISNLANRPDGNLFTNIIFRNNSYDKSYDLLSITDNQFKKYTFSEIKKDKGNISNMVQDPHKVFFYFNAKGYMLGASSGGRIIFQNPLYANTKSGDLNKENLNIKNLEKLKSNIEHPEELIIDVFKTKCNNSDKVLYWPIFKDFVSYSYDGFLSDIKMNFSISTILPDKYAKTLTTGDITYSASNIRKNFVWGFNNDDYVIVFSMAKNLKTDLTLKKIEDFSARRRYEYESSAAAQYFEKQYDELYRLYPYRVGRYNQLITVYDKEEDTYKQFDISTYSNNQKEREIVEKYNLIFSPYQDDYVNECKNAYKQRVEVFKQNKEVKTIMNTIASNIFGYQKKVASYIKDIQQIERKTKKLLFKKLMSDGDKKKLKSILFSTVVNDEFKELKCSNYQLYSLSQLINSAISIIGSANVLYDKIEKQLEKQIDLHANSTFNFNSKRPLNYNTYTLRNIIGDGEQLLNDEFKKLCFDDMQTLIDAAEEILIKY